MLALPPAYRFVCPLAATSRRRLTHCCRPPRFPHQALGRPAALLLLLGLLASLSFGQRRPATPQADQGQLDAPASLFAVMAAINLGGFDADWDSPYNHPLRNAVRAALRGRHPTLEADLKEFFIRHRLREPALEYSQYVSYALASAGPPQFEFRLLEAQLPPDVSRLQGFDTLLRRLWNEGGLSEVWQRSQPAIEEALLRYQEPAAQTILEVNAYTRQLSGGYLGREFRVYLDLLGLPNQVHIRNYLDDLYLVLSPSPEVQTSYIRTAYLQFLLDPMVMKEAEQINTKKSLEDYALGVGALDESYKNDFVLLTTRCLVKAVESRLAPPSQRSALVDKALREGFILTPYFAEALVLYEKQEQALRLYLPEMIKAIDVRKESRRLEGVQFLARKESKVVAPPPPPAKSQIELDLEAAEQLSAQKKFKEAKAAFQTVLDRKPTLSWQARAYFGLARIAAMENDGESAVTLFQQALSLEPDDLVKAWSHVYLGRLLDTIEEAEEARKNYEAALAIPGAPLQAKQMAERGIRKEFQPKPRP